MPELLVTAPAKINLHLELLGLRPDGFHELAMVMQSLDLADSLRLQPSADGLLSLRSDHPDLPVGPENLILRAGELLRRRAGLPELGARIELSKRIPVGAGLAGGSSDAAAALVGLDALWGCGFPEAALKDMAASLGSDVPYCLEGGTRLCFGRGERLEAAGGDPPSLGVLLLKHPAADVSTAWAYRRARERRGADYLSGETAWEERRQALRRSPLLAALRGEGPMPALRNDLQRVVEPEQESVARGLQLLRRAEDALAVAMSGSGPTVFALFADPAAARQAQRRLAPDLERQGFASWCCRCTGSGVSLEENTASP